MKKNKKNVLLTLIILSIMFLTLDGNALSSRQNISILAWSDDGESLLLKIKSRGPEGGGSLGFQIISGKNKINEYIEFSNDTSSGGGFWSQRISMFGCNKAVRKLEKHLKKLKFSNINFKSFCCWKSKRTVYSMLEIKKIKTDNKSLLYIKGYSIPKEVNGFLFKIVNQKLVVLHNNKEITTVP